MAGNAGNEISLWTVFSVLAGAIVSAIVSYILQRRSFAEARQQRAEDKIETRKTLGLNLFHKMMRITSTLDALKRSLDECFARAEADKFHGEPWHIVIPTANLPSRVKFTPEELTFLMLMDMNLFNDMGAFDEIHNSLLDVFELYRTKRTALTDMLPATMSELSKGSTVFKITGTTELPEAEMKKVAPRMAELNLLVEAMKVRTQQDAKEAWELLEKLGNALNKKFGLHLRVTRV